MNAIYYRRLSRSSFQGLWQQIDEQQRTQGQEETDNKELNIEFISKLSQAYSPPPKRRSPSSFS